jgi:NAD+ synthase
MMSVETRTGARSVHPLLAIDVQQEAARITDAIRRQVARTLRRRGVVLGLSGGIDSSVCAALCARALGPDRVIGLFLPEADSSPETTSLGRLVGDHLGIRTFLEDISEILKAAGCYRRRDEAIASVIPPYEAGYKSKLVMDGAATDAGQPGYHVFSVVVEAPDGRQTRARLTAEAYRAIVAATNFKQRVRKMMEYYHADRLNYAVAGTPNRLEYDQGFFVKLGDGAADVKPIAHLYKTQVYALADFLGVPEQVRTRPSTTDTYSLPQSQEEFYFSVPLATFDLCLYGRNHGRPPQEIAEASGLPAEHVERLYASIDSKRRATKYLQMYPLTIEPIAEVRHD